MFELRCMNDDVLEKEKNGDSSLKNSETFRKHYAAVLLQFDEVNKQARIAMDLFQFQPFFFIMQLFFFLFETLLKLFPAICRSLLLYLP